MGTAIEITRYRRANKLSLLVWDRYEAIVAACKAAWDFLISDPDRIRSIGTRAWAYVNTYSPVGNIGDTWCLEE
jgi:hypothetical protein